MEEVIQYWKKELNCFNYTKDLDLAQDNYFGQFEKQINMISRTLNELERLQKENERLKEKHKITCELNVGLLENTKECIPKQVIRDKTEYLEKIINELHPASDIAEIECYEDQIDVLKGLLGE